MTKGASPSFWTFYFSEDGYFFERHNSLKWTMRTIVSYLLEFQLLTFILSELFGCLALIKAGWCCFYILSLTNLCALISANSGSKHRVARSFYPQYSKTVLCEEVIGINNIVSLMGSDFKYQHDFRAIVAPITHKKNAFSYKFPLYFSFHN